MHDMLAMVAMVSWQLHHCCLESQSLYSSIIAGTMHSVLIKGGVLISGVVLYVARTMHSVLIKARRCPHFRGSFVCS